MKFVEDGKIAGTRLTSSGYLVADVRCARTGIQDYMGSEVGSDLERARVYRPESEVFSTDFLATFVGKPATDDHPLEPVTADSWKQYPVGSIGEGVLREGEYTRVPLTLMDAGIIQKVQGGKRETLMGYDMQLDLTPGTTPAGEAYDAKMTKLKMNHMAIVDRGRAGPEVRIGDSWGASPITNEGKKTMTLITIVVDGLSVETTDAGEKAIQKLQADNTALKGANDTAQATRDADATEQKRLHDSALAKKDTELATKDNEIKELKEKVLDAAALDALVEKRATLIAKASKLAKDAKFGGKSDLEIMTIAVDAADGKAFSIDKSAAYIQAAFDMSKIPEGTGGAVRDAMITGVKPVDAADNGYGKHVALLGDAWKGEAA